MNLKSFAPKLSLPDYFGITFVELFLIMLRASRLAKVIEGPETH